MATNDLDAEQIKLQRAFNDAQRAAISSVRSLEKAIDGATNAAIDKAAPALVEVAKKSSLLSDELKDAIKTTRGAAKAFDEIERRMGSVRELEKAFKSGRKDILTVSAELANLGIKLEEFRDGTIDITGTFRKLNAEQQRQQAVLKSSTDDLARSSVKLSKEFEGLKSRVAESATKFATAGTAVTLLTSAAKQFYGLGTDLVGKGMLGAAAHIATTANLMQLTNTELSELIGKNRATITAMGGGIAGVVGFTEAVQEGRKGLELFGKQSSSIAAGFIDTLTKNGMGFGNEKTRGDTMKYATLLKNQFITLNAAFGDTAEQFTAYYDELLKSETLQQRLNSLDAASARQMVQETILRQEQMRTLGLTNTQMQTMNKTLETMYNPNKNRQREAITERLQGRASLSMSVNELRRQGGSDNEQLAVRLDKSLKDGTYDRFRMAGRGERERMLQSKEYQQLARDMAMNEGLQAKWRDESGRGAESFIGYGAVDAREKAGETHQMLIKFGEDQLEAQRNGRVLTDDKKALALDNAGYVKNPKTGDLDLTGAAKDFATLRTTVDSVTAAMSNPLLAAIGGITAGAVAASGSLTALSVVAGKLAAKLGGSVLPGGGGKGSRGPQAKKLAALKGGGLGALIGLAAGWYGDSGGPKASSVGVLGDALTWGSTGALVGSMIAPGVGTAIGAGLGGLAGGGYSLWNNWTGVKDDWSSKSPSTSPTPKPQTSATTSAITLPKSSKFAGFGAETDNLIKEASNKFGVDEKAMRGLVKMEDGWTGKMSPTGALGAGQMIQSTWNGLAKTKEGRELGMTPVTSQNFQTADDPRRDPRMNIMATALLMKQNNAQLQANGIQATPEASYMMHNIGPGVIDAMKGRDVSQATRVAMGLNNMRPGGDPMLAVQGQMNKFKQNYIAANNVVPSVNTSPIVNAAPPTPIMQAGMGQSAVDMTLNNKLMEEQTGVMKMIHQTLAKPRVGPEGFQADRQSAAAAN